MNPALEQWRERLSGSGLPVFARTVRDVSHVAADHISSAKDLSAVVGKDAGMTSRLLQIVNSSLFNFQSRKIDTVNAAVVMVGFDAIKELAVSISVIDEVLKGAQHTRVSHCMAQSFLAAAHAKSFCGLVAPKQAEEVFVAALLKQVGAMAFWSKAKDEACELERVVARDGDRSVVIRKALGFDFDDLSELLVDEWSLGELTKRVLRSTDDKDPIVGCATSGHELADAIIEHGWDSACTRDLLGRIARRLALDEKVVTQLAESSLEQTEELAQHFGVDLTEPKITAVQTVSDDEAVEPSEAVAAYSAEPAADQLAHAMESLQELAIGLEEGWSRDRLMEHLVHGVRMSTAARASYFMLLTPDRKQLIVKYADTQTSDLTLSGHCCAIEGSPFGAALQDTKVIVQAAQTAPPLQNGGECLLKGVHVGGKPVGLLVAEFSGAADEVASFRQFAQQIPLILTTAQ